MIRFASVVELGVTAFPRGRIALESREIADGNAVKLYQATSVPFAAPAGGKIAVKVVNHYGDEVLKVYTVG